MKEINEIEDDSHEVQIIARLSTGISHVIKIVAILAISKKIGE
jgi:hypothetical protein